MSVFGSADDIFQKKWEWFKSPPGYIFSIAAIVTLVGTIGTVKQSKREAQLESKVKEQQKYIEDLERNNELRLEQFWIISLFVQKLFHELSFSYTERITIYRFDSKGFVPLHRYSLNPTYCSQGRLSYPPNQGCISRAWSFGEFYTSGLPNPETSLEEYLNITKNEYGINRTVARKMQMKSRTFYSVTISTTSPPTQNIAVVVFESTKDQGFQEQEIKEKLRNSVNYEMICYLTEGTTFLRLSPDLASQEGY